MTCREAANLIPLLFDGELAPHQMRAVVLHSTLCPECEVELRSLEHLQKLVRGSVSAAVDGIDFSDFWPGIERRLVVEPRTLWQRLVQWWEGTERWPVRVPAYAALAAAAAFAMFYAAQSGRPAAPGQLQMAAGGAAWIDSVDADVEAVLLLEDRESQTALLWVGDRFPGEAE
ncbi:zf-HC2 domain-containing protein [Candidatus Binatia bacterium]|nr:zf-HC2 domain-containing protein [Candidatus Binatia bacterium]